MVLQSARAVNGLPHQADRCVHRSCSFGFLHTPCTPLHAPLRSIVATVPGVTDPALGAAPPSALHCCWMVNTWAVVTATVLLPWARAWQRERRARRLFAWQQLQEAAGEDGPAAGPADAPAAAGDAAAAAGSEDATAESPYPTPELAIDWGASTRDAWLLAVDCRPAWAWVLDAHLLSCAAWAALLLYATARGF